MLQLNHILGNIGDSDFSKKIHDLSHEDSVERVHLSTSDSLRKRLRVTTDKGTDCAIVLNRKAQLSNGSILWLDTNRAIIVNLLETNWLRLVPVDMAVALELGYFAGNLHWRVRFAGSVLEVALDGSEKSYLDRLDPYFKSGKVKREIDESQY